MDFLAGYRTYITGTAMAVYGVLGLFIGHLDQAQAVQTIGTGLGLIFLRKAIE